MIMLADCILMLVAVKTLITLLIPRRLSSLLSTAAAAA